MKRWLVPIALLAMVAVGSTGYLLIGPKPVTLHTGWKVTPVGDTQTVGDHLAGGQLSPNGKWILMSAVGQGMHRAYLLDAASGKVVGTADVARAWLGLGWSADSTKAYVSGGTGNSIHILNVRPDGSLGLEKTLPVGDLAADRNWLAGMVVQGSVAYVAANATDRVLKVDLETGKILGQLTLEAESAPYQVREARDGSLLVTLQGSDRLIRVNPETLQVQSTWNVGRHPNDILVLGDRVFVACGNDDEVMVLDLYNGSLEERIMVRPWPDAPAGSTPHALAASADGKRLYVAVSDNNAVAVVDIADRGSSKVEAYVPSGAYPTALATLKDGKLVIGAGKGLRHGPNGNTDKIDPEGPAGYPYIVTLLKGLISTVDVSSQDDLAQMTRLALANSPYRPGVAERPLRAPRPGANPVPSRLGDPSPIRHVLYIIKENRTYDQVFGDLKVNGKPYGNGEPKLTLFGESVAPNHRELARRYVLLDNFYASGDVSVDGHHWTNGAYVTDFMQRTWPQQYSGKGAPRLTQPLAETPNGRIWDQCRRAGVSYKTYYYHTRDRMNAEWAKARADGVRDYLAVDVFIRDFKEMEANGNVPQFMVMALSEDHTRGLRAGAFTPKACVASNDLGLGKIVEAISKSSLWSKFAIFVVEDDAQNGPDHVDAHRTVALVVSPYTYRRGIDSTHYTTVSMVRTISLLLGLKPMTQHDAAATPMYGAFHLRPDLAPYAALTPQQDLQVKNPPAQQSPLLASVDFSEPDQLTLAQEIELNRDIWRSVKGAGVPYPGAVRRYGFGSADGDE